MRSYLLFLALIFSSSILAQPSKTIFDIARNGTVNELLVHLDKNQKGLDEVDQNGNTPLILACYRGNISVAEYIINHSLNLNYCSQQGTALASLAVHYNKELVLQILKKGANTNLADANGDTPLFWAVKTQNEELIKILLQFKADKTIKNKLDKTAFEYAIETNNLTIINLLKD